MARELNMLPRKCQLNNTIFFENIDNKLVGT